MKRNNFLVIIILSILISAVISAVPETLNLHGRLTNSSGSPLSGNYNMTFRIYNVSSGGNALYELANQVVSVDSGIYHVILNNVNLPFSEQYYLGIQVEDDSEMTPRINLTSSPYTFRANVTDFLEKTRNYEMQNLTLGEKITFALGEIIDNLIDGFIRVTGNLRVEGIGNFSGTIYINNGTDITAFNDTERINSVNTTSNIKGLLQNQINGTELADTITLNANMNILGYNFSINNSDLFVDVNKGRVGIGTTNPSEKLDVSGNVAVSGNITLTDLTINGIGYLYNTPSGNVSIKSIVNKEYVDLAVTSLGAVYYMYNNTDSTGYKLCYLDPSNDSEVYDEHSGLTDDQYLDGWISAPGEAPQKLLKGVYDWFITLEKTTGAKTLRIYWKLYERKSDNSEVLIAISSLSNEIDGKSTYMVPLQLEEDYLPSDGSRIVGKLYASVSGGGNAPTLRIYYQGDTSSRWEIPANTEIFKNIFVPYTGAVQNVDLGSYDISATTAKLSNLSEGYIPYHISDANGLADSPIYTNGSNVGINTSTPENTLNVIGDINFTGLIYGNGSQLTGISGAGGNPAGTEGAIQFYDGGDFGGNASQFFINKSTGKVGIGTDSPGTLLHLSSPGDAKIQFTYDNDGTPSHAVIDYDFSSQGFEFRLGGTTGANTKVFFGNNGSVGIGTTSPGAKLHVDGGSTWGNSGDKATLYLDTSGGGHTNIGFGGDGSHIRAIRVLYNNTRMDFTRMPLLGNTSDPPITDLTINSDGNVGIGTTSPSSPLTISASQTDSTGGIRLLGKTDSSDVSYWSENQFAIEYQNSYGVVLTANGTSYLNGANARLGIGTTSPENLLNVEGSSDDGGTNRPMLTNAFVAQIRNTRSSGGYGGLLIDISSSAGTTNDYPLDVRYGGDVKFLVRGDGNVGIGTTDPGSYKLYLAGGEAYCDQTTCWNDASDIALKENITDLNYGLNEIMKIKPKRFKSKITNQTSIGMIAQELELIIPEVVSGEEGNKGISYGGLSPVLIKAIQEQQQQIEELKQENKVFKTEITILKAELCQKDKTYSWCK